MGQIAVDYVAPFVGAALPDNQYQQMFTAMHGGNGGGVVDGGAVTVSSDSTSFVVAPFTVVGGGRIAVASNAKTVAPTSPGALRTEYVVVHFDPLAGTAVVRTQTTPPVHAVNAGADQTFDVLLGTGTTSSTAPVVRTAVARGRSYPTGTITVDHLASLVVGDFPEGQVVRARDVKTLYVKEGGVWVVANGGPAIINVIDAGTVAWTVAQRPEGYFGNTMQYLTEYTIPAQAVPYRYQMSVQATLGSLNADGTAAPGTRWDLSCGYDGSVNDVDGAYFWGTVATAERVYFQEFTSRWSGVVPVGKAQRLYLQAFRAYGTATGWISGQQRKWSITLANANPA